jgi:hypothetical protein
VRGQRLRWDASCFYCKSFTVRGSNHSSFMDALFCILVCSFVEVFHVGGLFIVVTFCGKAARRQLII